MKQIFTNVAMTADRYSDWVDTRGASAATIHLFWAGSGTPVGAFKIEFSQDPVIIKEQARIAGEEGAGTVGVATKRGSTSAAKKVDVTSVIDPSAIVGTGFTVSGGSDGSTMLSIDSPPRWVRVFFDYTSGGSAASLLQGTVNLSGERV